MRKRTRILAVISAALLLASFGFAQIGGLIKIVGIWEIVRRFGPDVDREFNKLIRRDPKTRTATKVVPIITGGVNSRNAIGMVQVSGPKARVDTVRSVAQVEQDVLGIKIRAMIPIASESITSNITPVEEVGVTGIVDVKL